MDVLRLGVKSELQLPAYTTATAMPDPNLRPSPGELPYAMDVALKSQKIRKKKKRKNGRKKRNTSKNFISSKMTFKYKRHNLLPNQEPREYCSPEPFLRQKK